MPDTRHDLLGENLLSVRTPTRVEPMTVPQVLEALTRDDVASFRALQPHQSHAWHAFLVQVAALALCRAGRSSCPTHAVSWEELLIGLTEGRREPWCLVVEDLAQPAFMQPPVPEGTLEGFKAVSHYPDEDDLDILVKSKNHDVKLARVASYRPEHWVYALVCLQTMQGYSGSKNYGIARMNSGLGSRPCVAYAPGLSWGQRFSRDVDVSLRTRSRIISDYGYRTSGGRGLLWTVPWDGNSSLRLSDCDPFFIEVCRRVRLVEGGGLLRACRKTTSVPRIDAEQSGGDTGDPWTPVKFTGESSKALTLGDSGFTYGLLTEILFGNEFRPGASLVLRDEDDGELLLVAAALVRGQGRTEGYHERRLPVPRKVRGWLRRQEHREELGRRARTQIEEAGNAWKKALRPALLTLMQGGPETLDWTDQTPSTRFHPQFQRAVDDRFFEHLWDGVDRPVEEARSRWQSELRAIAEGVLEEAIASTPYPSSRLYRAISAAERVFRGGLRKQLPLAFPDETRRTGSPPS